MLDLHCHILPRIDDGENDLEDYSAIYSLAIAEGITHILAICITK